MTVQTVHQVIEAKGLLEQGSRVESSLISETPHLGDVVRDGQLGVMETALPVCDG